jgi:glutamate-1-semialdehyde 2,1-aminomutase
MGWGPCATSGLTSGGKVVDAGPPAFARFKAWLEKVRETCTASGIPLIYDETWAFQLGPGGAQEYLGVKAVIVTIGKSVGGGHAVGAVLGSHRFMERSDPDRPMRVSFVVGTFKGSPMVMGAMNAVLKWITSEEARAEFSAHEKRVQEWVASCNHKLKSLDLPLKVHAHRNLWCISFSQESPYNFLFHCYLRDAGLQMVWVGTAKALINLEFKEADLDKLTNIIVIAAKKFKGDEWWHKKDTQNPSLFQLPNLFAFVLIPTLQYWLGFGKRSADKKK